MTGMVKSAVVAAVAWLAVAALGLWDAARDDDNWELSYGILSVVLLLGAALTLVVADRSADGPGRRWRMVGRVVAGLGVLATIVAWALPLWMGVLGIAFVLLAAGARRRGPLLTMAAGQLGGIVVLIVATEAEVGRADEYGDYAWAAGLALLFTSLLTAAGVLLAVRAAGEPAQDRAMRRLAATH